ncbi:CrcB protein [Actinokineospora alba]|uniref:Fluoride-specific ion channel FluC n=1 Tax=Actinokineospora alba TaxID=504798 RepID=A0A1H0JVZ8_9PSEU|nr:fluoride efflux transporter CrcB [Actinokineospora alba]TDP68150.1 protein CrcB [Actinokineospora alba]SDH93217.1 CrcB protein [Actinokineospora alba]SDO47581.1 CrcB protein [Actinokineospora alba]
MAADIAAKATLAAVALGGAVGALARFMLVSALPGKAGGFPLGTLLVNSVGCLLIGALMVAVTELRNIHTLARPFLGVGVLGGFTTFSAYAEEVRVLLAPDTLIFAMSYLLGTVLCALVAVAAGMRLARSLL